MKTKLFTGILAATAALTGFFSTTGSASAQLPSNLLPLFQDAAQNERHTFNPNEYGTLFDLNNLTLTNSGEISAYFIGEGAAMRNQLSFQANGGSATTIWSDVSAVNNDAGDYLDWSGDPTDGTLHQGDSVNLGTFAAGTSLNFLLKTDHWHVGSPSVYSTSGSNPDGLQHALGYLFENRYLLVGFEDLYGPLGGQGNGNQNSDRDFNDTVLVIDMGKGLTKSVPEPSATLALAGVAAAGVFSLRRRRKVEIN